MPNPENLRPRRLTAEEASKIGRLGGKASVKAKREKKLLSQTYAEMLAERFDCETEDGPKRVTGAELIAKVAKGIIERGGAPAVAMMREIREATEGSKAAITGADGESLFPKEIVVTFVRPEQPDV